MSNEKNDGGPAFPYSALSPGGPQMYADCEGMSLRDWFAGQALAGMLSDPNVCGPSFIANSARLAYECADAMLKAREATND